MDERQMVESLKKQLDFRYQKILTHQNLTTLTNFKAELVQQFGYLPVLNEVDMILVDQLGHFYAIEVKCFTVKSGSYNRPFYDGIGQSLSLLRYGFDNVALWHLFSNDISQDRIDRYGAATWWFIRNQSRLPLEFTYFKVEENVHDPQFIVMQYEGPNTGADLIPVDRSNFEITWKYPNPFRMTEEGKGLRSALAKALNLDEMVI